MANGSLNSTEQNAVIRALRSGASWEEAVKVLPGNLDKRAVERNWREDLEDRAAEPAPSSNVQARIDPEEHNRILDENKALRLANEDGASLVTRLQASVDAANKEVEKGNASIVALTKERDNLQGEVRRLAAENEDLGAQVEALSAPGGKSKK